MTADKFDVTAIAGRLSEAQRRILCGDGSTGQGVVIVDSDGRTLKAAQRLNDKGLMGQPKPMQHWMAELTPLGIAVRNHLMEKNDVQG